MANGKAVLLPDTHSSCTKCGISDWSEPTVEKESKILTFNQLISAQGLLIYYSPIIDLILLSSACQEVQNNWL